ncbi:hypothetical protein [Flavobacterium sp. ACN6]|uniref:hypothetical protein n=1 Tax=Flavobacterium sp. ACN6 TaxID=1920426 RepID=UPI000BB2E779|nr:hypothetical protein [Flavobacterium sp. ACN6]PBJ10081.1 hypothetical protein BSF42_31500 [Flavobacterium sp. ACN6]
MKTNNNIRYTAETANFKCSKPDHIDTAHENEALDAEFTSGQNPDTTYKNQCDDFSDDSYEIIESGLNTAEDNTPFSTYDWANPYDSYNLDH